MTRRLRLHVPGGFYHVTMRGNHRQPIFYRAADRDLLDRVVANSLEQTAAKVHAYCWMTNHLHLLVQVAEVPLGRVMLRIASAYARTVQLRKDTTGHLFERRYHALLVDADNYLLAVLRYIHLNPVEAGLTKDPAAYLWSSHRVYLGLEQKRWVTTRFAMRLLASRPEQAASRYRQLFESTGSSGCGNDELAPHPAQPQVLGDDAFLKQIANKKVCLRSCKSFDELVQDCCDRFQITRELLVSRRRSAQLVAARAWLGHQAKDGQIATICAVARLLGRSEGAVRYSMSRHKAAAQGT